MSEYIALFCPHCGAHVNEDELESDHGYVHPPPKRLTGSLYTCGWCKIVTTDWGHVLRCRADRNGGPPPPRTSEAAQFTDLLRLREELD